MRGEVCTNRNCIHEHKLHNKEDHEKVSTTRGISLKLQKEYALRDINIHKLDLTNSFFFDTNTELPSITSILRKIERFTNKKDIFELQVLSDPVETEHLNYDEVRESLNQESDSDSESDDSLSSNSYYSNQEEIVKSSPAQAKDTEKPKVQEPLTEPAISIRSRASTVRKCRCPNCIY